MVKNSKRTPAAAPERYKYADTADVQEIEPVEEPPAQLREATPVDGLRIQIANDESKRGRWLQLSLYKPMPRRAALTLAQRWRRAKPATYGPVDGPHFQARLVPIHPTGYTGPRDIVTKATLYRVAVMLPTTESLEPRFN